MSSAVVTGRIRSHDHVGPIVVVSARSNRDGDPIDVHARTVRRAGRANDLDVIPVIRNDAHARFIVRIGVAHGKLAVGIDAHAMLIGIHDKRLDCRRGRPHPELKAAVADSEVVERPPVSVVCVAAENESSGNPRLKPCRYCCCAELN